MVGPPCAIRHTLQCILIVILHLTLDAYPSGPPSSACTDMQPTGHNADPQGGPSPYQISVNSDTYSPGQTISVTISGQESFRGFMLQARRKDEFRNTREAFGTFSSAPAGTKLTTCHSNADSSWSHDSQDDKTSVTIDWTAPITFEGDIAFRATIVQGPAQTYWEGQLSIILTYDGPTTGPTTQKTGGQPSIQPLTLLLAIASGLLSLIFISQQLH